MKTKLLPARRRDRRNVPKSREGYRRRLEAPVPETFRHGWQTRMTTQQPGAALRKEQEQTRAQAAQRESPVHTISNRSTHPTILEYSSNRSHQSPPSP